MQLAGSYAAQNYYFVGVQETRLPVHKTQHVGEHTIFPQQPHQHVQKDAQCGSDSTWNTCQATLSRKT
eukprot:4839947-Pyramimonas_sp.AAC.1